MKARRLVILCLMVLWVGPSVFGADPHTLSTQANVPIEITFSAAKTHVDPFSDVTLDVLFTQPDKTVLRVPAFWDGGRTWKVRYASPQIGTHHWKSECSSGDDAGLNGVAGVVEISKYTGENPLFLHGPIRVADDKRHFQYADGTPFFWLGDTWWMGLAKRLHWPDEFQRLAADRQQKGFNVVQIVAGLYPDMPPFDPRGANEAGFPWEGAAGKEADGSTTASFKRIRPEYFDAADLRLRHLVDRGISPCIVGAWGYFLPWVGVDKAKAHWRYLIARYGAWPVIWCAAGEANLPYYLAKGFPYDDRRQTRDWTEVMRSIRAVDPWHRMLTVHPTAINRYTARHATDDEQLLDFDMLQTPHGQAEAAPVALGAVRESFAARPTMPVIDGEASYEMLGDSLPTAWTRAMFWLAMTNGAAGHTYGANGIWQNNRRGDPHGASPHGGSYGKISWDEAMRLPGSTQVSLGKQLFESLPWTKLMPLPDSVEWTDAPAPTPLGDWIWFSEGDPRRDAPIAARYFRRSFEVSKDATVARGVLRISADDKFTAWLNGVQVAAGANWRTPVEVQVTKELRPGRNILAVRAENVQAAVKENPAGLIAGLRIEFSRSGSTTILTDTAWKSAKNESPNWRTAEFDDSAWPAALATAKHGEAPWGNLDHRSDSVAPQACGEDARLMLIYALEPRAILVHKLRLHGEYAVTLFDPVTGERTSRSTIAADEHGDCRIDPPPHDHDWVAVLNAK